MEPEQNNMNMGGSMGEEKNNGSAGPIIGIIIILVIIILGGLYFWGQRANEDAMTDDEINMQSDSDEAAAIEADLNATEIENLDAELNAS